MITLADPIAHARRCFGDKIAVIDGERVINYTELAERCDRLAAGLSTLGIRPDDRVALLAANGLPKMIEISRDPLPKSGPGKILKRVLRDRYLFE